MAFTLASGGMSKEDLIQEEVVEFVEFWAVVRGRRDVSRKSAAVEGLELSILGIVMKTAISMDLATRFYCSLIVKYMQVGCLSLVVRAWASMMRIVIASPHCCDL